MAITTKEYITALNDLASREMRMQLVYSISAGVLVGPWRDALADQFKDHQKQETRHAEAAFRRIGALGGVVSPKFNMPPTWESLDDMLDGISKLEEEGIRAWQDLHDKLDDGDAFRYTIEDILAEEQHHWDEAKRWRRERKSFVREDLHIHLPDGVPHTGGQEQDSDPEMAPSEEDPEPEFAPDTGDAQPEEVKIYPVVGEERRLKVYGLGASYFDGMPIGEAWQDESGVLYGTGLCHTMLFEPFANRMYINSAAGLDTSPLAVLAYRLSLSPFVRVEWEDPDAE